MLDRVRAVIKAKVKSTSWDEINAAAKAVLEEIRQPTTTMIDVGDNNETGYAADIWREMATAALKGDPHA